MASKNTRKRAAGKFSSGRTEDKPVKAVRTTLASNAPDQISSMSSLPVENSLDVLDSVAGPSITANINEDQLRELEDENVFSDVEEEGEIRETKRTQTAETLSEWLPLLPDLLYLILAGEASPEVTDLCPCGRGRQRTHQCNDCYRYQSSCELCFVQAHASLPFHWARVWQAEGYYNKCDISYLLNQEYVLHVCSRGTARCPNPGEPNKVTIAHTNGIHSTVLAFCRCAGAPDEVTQCMMARLFPATVKHPRTMMTFEVLDQFHEHQMTSKKGAYDYLEALRRLTDGAFTLDVADPYPQFLLVMRLWRRLRLDKHTGQAHHLHTFFPHRAPGSLITFCPCCPEEGFNMEKEWERTPDELKHLVQIQQSQDGNFHLNQFSKNNDPNDVPLETVDRVGYFPDETEAKEYLKVAREEQEKSTCNYLNVVNNQNKKKFKNMAITGEVAVVCSHVMIASSVNLHKGEGFAYGDLAWKHAVSHTRYNRKPSYMGCKDRVLSYDCNCQYSVNFRKRIAKHFPAYSSTAERLRHCIPLMHIQDHKLVCSFCFNPIYMPSCGHFHGEAVETIWVELNQLGPATRQMNFYHRLGLLTAGYTYWNWRKLVQIHVTLQQGVKDARKRHNKKRQDFLRLSVVHHDKIAGWLEFEESQPRLANGIVEGIYQHSDTDAPSLQKVYDQLLSTTTQALPTEDADGVSDGVLLLQQGCYIQRQQQNLRMKVTELTQTETVQKQSQKQRKEIEKLLVDFRTLQASVCPSLSIMVASLPDCEPENEKLCLPSDFLGDERASAGLVDLAEMEMQIREAELYDNLKLVQAAARSVSIVTDKRKKDVRGTNAGLRSALSRKKLEVERDTHVANYEASRLALLRLAFPSADRIPPMTVADTFRRSTFTRRQLGDSHRTNSVLYDTAEWTPDDHDSDMEVDIQDTEPLSTETGTQSIRRVRGPRKKPMKKEVKKETKEDGWIWSSMVLVAGRKYEQNLAKFEEESDRIEWFRAREDERRWREACEKYQADFLHCLRAFRRMEHVWSECSRAPIHSPSHPTLNPDNAPLASTSLPRSTWSFGHAAYARRQAAMYKRLTYNCAKAYNDCGFAKLGDGEILADTVARQRQMAIAEDEALIREEVERAAKVNEQLLNMG